jgi:hypothetical protein
MDIGDIVETVAICRFGDQVGLNVRHWATVTKTGTGGTLLQVADTLYGILATIYAGSISNQATFIGFTAQKIWPLPKSIAMGSSGAALPGGLSGDPLPTQIAGLVSFRTAIAGRKERGRIYIPFAAESQNTVDKEPSLGYQTNLGGIGNFYSAALPIGDVSNGNGLAGVIWHRTSHTYSFITAYRVRPMWATQRRRGAFGRPNPLTGAGLFLEVGVS